MEMMELQNVAKANGLVGRTYRDFMRFMAMRFPHEREISYAQTWARRFRTAVSARNEKTLELFYIDAAWAFSDGKSRTALLKINPQKYRHFQQLWNQDWQ